uniref:(northern house mosquito) hypothetical protein n=1 Tax=Culex pipiens TaxID=7175 RepID=A0A8D8BPY5_CULPI
MAPIRSARGIICPVETPRRRGGMCFAVTRDLGWGGLHRGRFERSSGNPGEGSAGGAHRFHFGPLAGVFEAHVVANGVRVGEAASALDHRTDGAVPGVVPVQVLPENARFQRDFAEWAWQQVDLAGGGAGAGVVGVVVRVEQVGRGRRVLLGLLGLLVLLLLAARVVVQGASGEVRRERGHRYGVVYAVLGRGRGRGGRSCRGRRQQEPGQLLLVPLEVRLKPSLLVHDVLLQGKITRTGLVGDEEISLVTAIPEGTPITTGSCRGRRQHSRRGQLFVVVTVHRAVLLHVFVVDAFLVLFLILVHVVATVAVPFRFVLCRRSVHSSVDRGT